MEQLGPIITGVGSAVAIILGAITLLLKARASSAKPARLLERLVDWLEAEGLFEKVPATLQAAIRKEFADDDNEGSP